MRKSFVIILLLAFFGMAYASINQVEEPVVMTEKVVNPNITDNAKIDYVNPAEYGYFKHKKIWKY